MTYIMSDIHGNLRRFNSVMQQINLRTDDVLYVLGDVIDRHTDGVRILRKLMKMENCINSSLSFQMQRSNTSISA